MKTSRAVINYDGSTEWWIKGMKRSKEEWWEELSEKEKIASLFNEETL